LRIFSQNAPHHNSHNRWDWIFIPFRNSFLHQKKMPLYLDISHPLNSSLKLWQKRQSSYLLGDRISQPINLNAPLSPLPIVIILHLKGIFLLLKNYLIYDNYFTWNLPWISSLLMELFNEHISGFLLVY